MEKKLTRLRRAKRGRMRIQTLGVPRLCVHRTSQHIYAQIILPSKYEGSSKNEHKVIASASTLDKELNEFRSKGGNVLAATKVGELIAQRSKAKGVAKVAFDRSGYKYHGRVKALADAARTAGLDF